MMINIFKNQGEKTAVDWDNMCKEHARGYILMAVYYVVETMKRPGIEDNVLHTKRPIRYVYRFKYVYSTLMGLWFIAVTKNCKLNWRRSALAISASIKH